MRYLHYLHLSGKHREAVECYDRMIKGYQGELEGAMSIDKFSFGSDAARVIRPNWNEVADKWVFSYVLSARSRAECDRLVVELKEGYRRKHFLTSPLDIAYALAQKDTGLTKEAADALAKSVGELKKGGDTYLRQQQRFLFGELTRCYIELNRMADAKATCAEALARSECDPDLLCTYLVLVTRVEGVTGVAAELPACANLANAKNAGNRSWMHVRKGNAELAERTSTVAQTLFHQINAAGSGTVEEIALWTALLKVVAETRSDKQFEAVLDNVMQDPRFPRERHGTYVKMLVESK
jgi:hypothetical protein